MFSRVSSGQRRRSYCTQSSWTIRWNHHRYLGSGELDLGRNIIWQTTPWMLRLNWSRLGESPLIDLWNQSIYSPRYAKQKLWEGTKGPSHSRSKSSSPLSRLGPLQDPLFRTLIHDSHFGDNCLRLRKMLHSIPCILKKINGVTPKLASLNELFNADSHWTLKSWWYGLAQNNTMQRGPKTSVFGFKNKSTLSTAKLWSNQNGKETTSNWTQTLTRIIACLQREIISGTKPGTVQQWWEPF